MLGRSEGDGEGESASVAHGPAEFSALLEEDFTRGLDIAAREGEYRVPPPPFSEGIFPCSDCHTGAGEGDAKRRALEAAHTEIRLEHGGEDRWCLDCHDLRERDKLRLANGTLVPFEESYRLCGQCHGDKYRDWRSGIHGKRTGYWNGPKRYLLCAHCHNPHSPRFKPIRPLPPPVSPSHQARPAAGVAAETGGGS
ncbi:MAG: hypothetical protein HYZ53_30055 [Planctomycetes bacterium]|nr:hypothetical protein [Planctomycetota bacterium]